MLITTTQHPHLKKSLRSAHEKLREGEINMTKKVKAETITIRVTPEEKEKIKLIAD